jgi:sulfate permease, SulP family
MVHDPSGRTATARRFAGAVPILRWLPSYRRRNLAGDVLAGAVVAALLVPQSLGYARIAGVPIEVGLYAVPLALVAYAIFGSSPQLVVGPASTVAIVSGSLVVGITREHPDQVVAVTAALALATGLVLIAVGLMRVGWVAEFLSKPIVTGFVFGLTLTIVVGELPALLGLPKPSGDLLGVLVGTARNLGSVDGLTALVGAVSLAGLFLGGRFAPRVPWGLVTLVAGTALSARLDLAGRGVTTVGPVPSGLPPLGLPRIDPSLVGPVLVGGVSLALVALAEGLAASRMFAARGGYQVRTEQELVGMGAANLAAGISGGLAVAGSLSKTAAAAQAGGRSQVVGLAAAVVVVIAILTITQHIDDLPLAVLSAIVVSAVWRLMDVASLRRYRAIRRADFVAALVAMLGVVVFGPLPGLGIAIATSLLAIIYRSSRPRVEVMGKIDGEKAAWGRLQKHPDRRPVPGVLVVRLDAPLFWANSATIEQRLLDEVAAWPGTRAVVLDLEATTQLDTTTVDGLDHLLEQLRRSGVDLFLVRVLHPVHAVLARAGFLDRLGPEHVWHSISQGVRAARRLTGLKKAAVEAGVEAAEEEPEHPAHAERLAVDVDGLPGPNGLQEHNGSPGQEGPDRAVAPVAGGERRLDAPAGTEDGVDRPGPS